MKFEVFSIYQTSVSKFADIELQNDCIVWMNTNIDKGGAMKVGEMPGNCNYPFIIKEVAFAKTNPISGKVTHQISIPKERKNLYLNLGPEQLKVLYPKKVSKTNYYKILTLLFAGIAALSALFAFFH